MTTATALGIILGGCLIGYSVWEWFDWYIDRWERRTGRDWVTGRTFRRVVYM